MKSNELFIKSLKNVTDEKEIKKTTTEYFKENKLEEATSRHMTILKNDIKKEFPDASEFTPGYYYTSQGKGAIARWEHLSIWYLTSNTDRWVLDTDELRKDYFSLLADINKQGADSETNKEAIAAWLRDVPKPTNDGAD